MAGKRGFQRRRSTQYTHKKQKNTMPHCGTAAANAQGSLKPLMVLKTILLQMAAVLSCLMVVSCHRDGALDLAICYKGGFQQAVLSPNSTFCVLVEGKSRSPGHANYVGTFTKNQRKYYKGAGANDSILFVVMDDIPALQYAYPYGPEPTDDVCRELVLSPTTEVYIVPVKEIEIGASGAFTIKPRLRELYRVHLDVNHQANAPAPASASPSAAAGAPDSSRGLNATPAASPSPTPTSSASPSAAAAAPDSSRGLNTTPAASPSPTPTSSASPSAAAGTPSGIGMLQGMEALCHGRPWEVALHSSTPGGTPSATHW